MRLSLSLHEVCKDANLTYTKQLEEKVAADNADRAFSTLFKVRVGWEASCEGTKKKKKSCLRG